MTCHGMPNRWRSYGAKHQLAVVFSVAKGPLRHNKGILIPATLLTSVFVPWIIQMLLMWAACICATRAWKSRSPSAQEETGVRRFSRGEAA